MSRGRPSGLELDSASRSPVREEVVVVDDRGRINLPTSIISDLEWLANDKLPTDALATSGHSGQLSIRDWTLANTLLTAHRELSESGELEALSAIQAKFARVRIGKDRRLTLGALLHFHLDINAPCRVVLVKLGNSIEIQTSSYRQKLAAQYSDHLPDFRLRSSSDDQR